jgi:hypothetical protein
MVTRDLLDHEGEDVMVTESRIDPHASVWHLFGAIMRHYRETELKVGLRKAATDLYIDFSVLGRWERGERTPPPETIPRLDDAYRAGGVLSALYGVAKRLDAAAESDRLRKGTFKGNPPSRDGDDAMERRAAVRLLAALGVGTAVPVSTIDTILSDVNRSIGDRDELHLDDWERIVQEYGFRTNAGPLGVLIKDLTADITEIKHALDRKPSESSRASLLRIIASLSQVLACELMHTQAWSEARRAHRTARWAADASGDRALRVSIRAGEAWNAFSMGQSPETVVSMTDDAISIAGDSPSSGLANAHSVRATCSPPWP